MFRREKYLETETSQTRVRGHMLSLWWQQPLRCYTAQTLGYSKYVPKRNEVKILSPCHWAPINLSVDKATSLDTYRVLKLILITVTVVPTV